MECKRTGIEDYEKLLSLAIIGSPLASIVLVSSYGFVYDTFRNYNIVLIFLLSILVLGRLSVFIGYRNSKKLNQFVDFKDGASSPS